MTVSELLAGCQEIVNTLLAIESWSYEMGGNPPAATLRQAAPAIERANELIESSRQLDDVDPIALKGLRLALGGAADQLERAKVNGFKDAHQARTQRKCADAADELRRAMRELEEARAAAGV